MNRSYSCRPLTADEFGPPADQPVLRDGYRTILYHRRGYAGSSAVDSGTFVLTVW